MFTELPANEMLEAEKVIDKGADAALFYFWYNLFKAYYHPVFSVDEVEKQARYYAEKHPHFEGEIINWFNNYCDKIKTYANNRINASA